MVLPVRESDLSEELPLLSLSELWLYFLKEHVLLMEGAERSAADISASEYRTPLKTCVVQASMGVNNMAFLKS